MGSSAIRNGKKLTFLFFLKESFPKVDRGEKYLLLKAERIGQARTLTRGMSEYVVYCPHVLVYCQAAHD